MKITKKGQVTIPQQVRESAGLLPYSEVDFEVRGREVVIYKIPRKTRRGQAVIDQLKGRGDVRMTTDEIMALTRET